MDKVNVFNQMAQYDFSTPIKVTMIFEDSDDDCSQKYILKKQGQNDDGKQIQTSAPIEQTLNEENSVCIFTSSAAGGEISININSDILIARSEQYYSQKQSKRPSALQEHDNINQYPLSSPVTPREMRNDNHLRQDYYSQNIDRALPQRPPPPHYNSHLLALLNQAPNARNLNPNQGNISQTMRQSNQTTSFLQNKMNSFTLPTSNNPYLNKMHSIQLGEKNSFALPVISHVTSLQRDNLNMANKNGRCCICGSFAVLRCLCCNKLSYCSYLCQQLDEARAAPRYGN